VTRPSHPAPDARSLAARKAGRRISVCLPARDEATTVGAIVRAIIRDLVVRVPLVDEVLVVDDRSIDGTGAVAAAAGARVVRTVDLLPDPGGKGDALWVSVHASRGDVVVWCDADIVSFDTGFVTRLVQPLLDDPTALFVKGYYERPTGEGTGGRTTELVARPVIAMLFPELAHIAQPLAGEYAARRDVLEAVPFVQGYGVELGLLVDVARRHGVGSIHQVDLGVRRHRNRPLDELAPQALAVLQAACAKAGLVLPGSHVATLVRPGFESVRLEHRERPPLLDAPTYLAHHA
jgi:glucosyl-3-phosphoglycerate synthase